MKSDKKEYKKPELIKHGDLKTITLNKISGGYDGMGLNHQDSF